MSCDHIDDLLYDYATNQLDESERSSVDVHLKECQDCQENLRLLKETLPIVDTWQAPRLSPAIVDRLADSARKHQTPWWKRFLNYLTLPSKFMLPVEAVAVASITLAIFVGVKPEEDVISRGGLTIEMPDTEVSNPIRLKVTSVQGGMDDLKDLIETYGGQIRRHKSLSMIVGFSIDESHQEQFFEKLSQIGQLVKPSDGYKSDDGTIVMLIVE